VPLVIPAPSPADAIVQVANQRQPDLVLLGWRRSTFGRRLMGGSVGEVLRSAKADVAVLVDPAGQGLVLRKGARIAVPHGGGFHEDVGLDLALRLAEASGAEVTLVGPADEKGAQELAERAAQAYEGTGVWTIAAPVEGDVHGRLVEEANQADLVVMGVSDEWVRDQHSLGELRDSVAARASAPLLIVRRHGQRGQRGPSRWLRRQREWMDEAPSDEAAEALTA
jgi:nucleotide-binding universal stress UspA family protein